MRICFVSRRYFPAISGMSIYAHNLLAELVAASHDVVMISQYRNDPFGKSVYGGGPPPAVVGVKVIGLEALGEQSGGQFGVDVDAMVAAIAKEHALAPFDVLHAQYGYPNGWAVLLAAKQLGVPTVVSIQGGDGHWIGSCCEAHRLAMVRVINHAGRVVIGGASFAQEVSERLQVPASQFIIIPGAVDTATFCPSRELVLPGRSVSMLYHGRVDRRKGVLDFIEALAMLPGSWHATISGIGPDSAAASALVEQRALTERVTFSGYVAYQDVPELYRQHDIFVSPTHAEGFSNTILEAMASGCAIVSCRSVGVLDCIRDGDNGLLVDVGDVASLRDALASLVSNKELRTELATRALVECRATYSWRTVGQQLVDLYRQIEGTTPSCSFEDQLPNGSCRFHDEPHLL